MERQNMGAFSLLWAVFVMTISAQECYILLFLLTDHSEVNLDILGGRILVINSASVEPLVLGTITMYCGQLWPLLSLLSSPQFATHLSGNWVDEESSLEISPKGGSPSYGAGICPLGCLGEGAAHHIQTWERKNGKNTRPNTITEILFVVINWIGTATFLWLWWSDSNKKITVKNNKFIDSVQFLFL